MKNDKLLKLVFLSITLISFSYQTPRTVNATVNNNSNTLQDSSRLSFYKGDTIAYVNFIYRNMAKYVGKPLSVLLKDLDFKINQFIPNVPHKRDGKTYGISLIPGEYWQHRKLDTNGDNQDIALGVGWQSFVLRDSIKLIITANGPPNYYCWSPKAEEYFGKQIVGNLWLYNYMKR